MAIARTPYDALPSSVLDELEAAGVPARPVYDAIVLALEEDLPDGATDVTSDATIPADALGVADFAAREPGIVAGLGVAELVFHYVMGRDVEVSGRVPDGTPRRARRRGDAGVGTGAGPAHRRAHRAQLRLPPLRRGHGNQPVGRRARRHLAPGSSTPGRRCRRTARCRSTPCAAAAA